MCNLLGTLCVATAGISIASPRPTVKQVHVRKGARGMGSKHRGKGEKKKGGNIQN